MGEALLRGVLRGGFLPGGFLPDGAIVVSDPAPARRELLSQQFKVAVTDDNLVPAGCDRVVLAVKPQVMADLLKQIAPAIRKDCLVISIAAGVTTSRLDKGLGGKGRIVRVISHGLTHTLHFKITASGCTCGDYDFEMKVPNYSFVKLGLGEGKEIQVSLRRKAIHVFETL